MSAKRILTFAGKSLTFSEWSKVLNIPVKVLHNRFYVSKLTIEQVLTAPYSPRKAKRCNPKGFNDLERLRIMGLRYERRRSIKSLHKFLLINYPEFLYPKNKLMVA